MNEKLSSEEKHKFNHAWKAYSLVEDFGKTTITVLFGWYRH